MDGVDAALLGAVEGITEDLPVSSTGHLIVAQRALGIPEGDAANAYAISIQGGAILAVVVLYARRIVAMLRGLAGRDPEGAHVLRSLLAAFAPAALAGVLLGDVIESALFGIWPVVAAWIAGGVLILLLPAGFLRREGAGIETLALRGALIVGACQCLALWPGTSRSLVTILGGLLAGLSLPAAVEFSFLLGLVTLTAATAYDTVRHGDAMLHSYGAGTMLIGMASAFLSAMLAIRWMVGWLTRRGLAVFGWWRLGAAAVTAALALSGWFDA
jgi:undecaprenyl-diphosphatase